MVRKGGLKAHQPSQQVCRCGPQYRFQRGGVSRGGARAILNRVERWAVMESDGRLYIGCLVLMVGRLRGGKSRWDWNEEEGGDYESLLKGGGREKTRRPVLGEIPTDQPQYIGLGSCKKSDVFCGPRILSDDATKWRFALRTKDSKGGENLSMPILLTRFDKI